MEARDANMSAAVTRAMVAATMTIAWVVAAVSAAVTIAWVVAAVSAAVTIAWVVAAVPATVPVARMVAAVPATVPVARMVAAVPTMTGAMAATMVRGRMMGRMMMISSARDAGQENQTEGQCQKCGELFHGFDLGRRTKHSACKISDVAQADLFMIHQRYSPPFPSMTTTEVKMKAGQADMPASAATAVAGVPAPMAGTRAAAMANGAIAINRMAMAVIARDGSLTINRRAARTAGVRDTAAARMTVSIACLAGGRTEDGEADRDGQQGDDLFHEGWRIGFDLSPQHGGVIIRRSASPAIRDSAKFFCRANSPFGMN